MDFQGGMGRSENHFLPRKDGCDGGNSCRTWEEGKDEKVDCVQHLGRRWIEFSAECEFLG